MTREEAAAKIGYIIDCVELGIYCGEDEEVFESLDIALAALRPITREQVEKVWRGCEPCTNSHARQNLGYQFCEHCGRPLTDEGMKMLIERLEALKDD